MRSRRPPPWKGVVTQIERAINETARRQEEYEKRSAEQQIAASADNIKRLESAIETYSKQQTAREEARQGRENKTITALWSAALFTFILAVLSFCQLREAGDIADTQHADTKSAIDTANRANSIAKTTAERQAADTTSALNLSKASADAATMSANEAIADRRPFVGIDGSEITIDKPLTFKNGWATVEFKVILRNVGKSVAFNVTTHISQIQLSPLVLQGIPFNTNQLSARLRDRTHCSETIVRQWTDAGTMILPGGTNVVDITTDAAHTVPGVDLSLGTDAWLTFCVSYSDDNNRPHATGFVLAFERDKQALIFPDNGIVPGKFIIYPWGTSEF
jgi:hypothetical protein